MRKAIAKGLYLLLTELVAVYLVAWPVYAFQISSSSTGYVRVATASAVSAYQVAQRAAFTSAVASAVSAPTMASVAVRIATGPVGWTALGVSAALTLAGMYYSAQDVQAVKTAALAAAPPVGTQSNGSGTTLPSGAVWNPASCVHPCAINGQQYFYVDSPGESSTSCYLGNNGGAFTDPAWPGWVRNNGAISGPTCRRYWTHTNNGTTTSSQQEMGFTPPSSLTLGEYHTYVQGLPAANPNSIESKTTPLGQRVTAPVADNVTTLPVTPAQVVPTVKPASQVNPTDAVIDPNAPAPSGPQAPVTNTQTTTTTTTTTTNPDGSTTKTEAETAVQSCSAGNHDPRTFGSVLQDHMNVWQGSGLLSALNLLKTLSWPTTIPTYSLSSSLFGTFTLDFSAWAGMLTALRSLIIAISSFVAYRIVFVGNK
ncbi:MAG: hypothetical protein ABL983_03720 [Nitrospira sp.]